MSEAEENAREGTAQDVLAGLAKAHRPRTLLVIGAAAVPPGMEEAALTRVSAAAAEDALAQLGRFDFAVASEVTEQLEAPAAAALLGRLKNLHTDRFLLLVDAPNACLDDEALLALALRPLAAAEDGRRAWLYDIDDYNPERPWNSPEDWANPQNFHRYRW